MSQVEYIPTTYDEAVKLLAQWQAEVGADDLRVFAAENVGDKIVRLIDVSEDFPDVGSVPVVRQGPSEDFPFRSALALARPEQWAAIRSGNGRDNLPADWKIAGARQVWPPAGDSTVE